MPFTPKTRPCSSGVLALESPGNAERDDQHTNHREGDGTHATSARQDNTGLVLDRDDTVRCGLVVDAAIVVVVFDDDGGMRGVSAVVLAINLHADGAGELVVAGRRFGLGERVLAVLQSPEVS